MCTYTIMATVHHHARAHGCMAIAFPSSHGWSRDTSGWIDVQWLEQELDQMGDNSHSIFATHCGRVTYQRNANNTQYPVYSVGKTFVTTWAAILVHNGGFVSLDEEIPYSNHSLFEMYLLLAMGTWACAMMILALGVVFVPLCVARWWHGGGHDDQCH